jgi:hypothetical protein
MTHLFLIATGLFMAFAERSVGPRFAEVNLQKEVSASEWTPLAVTDQYFVSAKELFDRLRLGGLPARRMKVEVEQIPK